MIRLLKRRKGATLCCDFVWILKLECGMVISSKIGF